MNKYFVKVYYDGLCPLCFREINHYRNQPGAESIYFVDITSDDFNPDLEGLDVKKINRYIHGKNSQGELITGVDVFLLIWATLPRYRFLTFIFKFEIFKVFLRIFYSLFINIRPYLPRMKRQCQESPFCSWK